MIRAIYVLVEHNTQHQRRKTTRKIELSVIISGDKLQRSKTVAFLVFFLWVSLRPKKWTTILCALLSFTTDTRIGYCKSQRATVWLMQNRTPFPQESNACTRSTTTWSLCISCHWTRKDLHWTSAWRLYRVHFTCYSLHRDWELSWSHSFIETMV